MGIEVDGPQVDGGQDAARIADKALGESERHRRARLGQRRDKVARVGVGIFGVELEVEPGDQPKQPRKAAHLGLLRAKRRVATGDQGDVDSIPGQRIEHAHLGRDDHRVAERLDRGRSVGLLDVAVEAEQRPRFPRQAERMVIERARVRIMDPAEFGGRAEIAELREETIVAAG